MPEEAEALFAVQLAHSRSVSQSAAGAPDEWSLALVCAVGGNQHVLGGVYLDIGPIGGKGPLAARRLAYLERTLVRPEYRCGGVATETLRHAIRIAGESGCEYIRCSNNWDNAAETALFRRCGFALVDLDGESDEEPCYLAVRPLQNLQI
ncbi:MAG: GNAT family N-acetyltransferase [Candidatus Brocadiaceae bacterium]|nr:GNAT family N-acetyltransferase [Candidatus Brocadiaceae bacterium]